MSGLSWCAGPGCRGGGGLTGPSWRLSAEGRKLLAGSALFTASGKVVGVARATWIRLG